MTKGMMVTGNEGSGLCFQNAGLDAVFKASQLILPFPVFPSGS
jgi:hypothetical protein